jgi:hypothetical protein
MPALDFRPESLAGGPAPEDGFGYVHDSERAHVDSGTVVHLRHQDMHDVEGWVVTSADADWWRAVAPGPPGSAERRFSVVRLTAAEGSVTTVWSWKSGVTGVVPRDGVLVIQRGDLERHEHARRDDGWAITLHLGAARSSIDLGGGRRAVAVPPAPARARVLPPPRPLHLRAGATPLTFALAERAYRRSEESWQDAGAPRATVTLEATRRDLVIAIAVEKPEVVFRPPNAEDPALDNEHPDIHSDGAQLYVAARGWDRFAAWLAVPEDPPPRVRVRAVDGARGGVPVVATWSRERQGYAMRFEVPLDSFGSDRDLLIALDVIVNDMGSGRVRRRGQLALSGGGDWIYLQGDRQSPARFLPLVIERG